MGQYPNCMQDISDDVHFIVRRAFVKICDGNRTQALILGVLEAKTNERMACINQIRAEHGYPELDSVENFEPRDLMIRMPIDDWKVASFGVLSRFLIVKESLALAAAGFLTIAQHKRKLDRAYFYRLNISTIIASVRALDEQRKFGFQYLSE